MKKTILAGLMVIAFCITWWVVAGEALQARQQTQQAATTGDPELCDLVNGIRPSCAICWDEVCAILANVLGPSEYGGQNIYITSAHFRTQASWGIGAGLLADVLLLVGVVAWQKITFKA